MTVPREQDGYGQRDVLGDVLERFCRLGAKIDEEDVRRWQSEKLAKRARRAAAYHAQVCLGSKLGLDLRAGDSLGAAIAT